MTMDTDASIMVKYQFQIEDDKWRDWKNTVPRSKSLDQRIRELIEADTEGRVQERKAGGEGRSSDDNPQGERREDHTPEPGPEPTTSHAGREEAEQILRGLDLPGGGQDYERRVDAVLAIYDKLSSNPGNRLSKSDFADVLDDTDVGYAGGFSSLWSNWVKSNPAQGHEGNVLEQLPGVEMRSGSYVYSQ